MLEAGTGVRRNVMSTATADRAGLRDEDIRLRVEQAVRAALPGHGELVRARVGEGVVLLVGRVVWRSELARIDRVVREIPGVVEVRDRIGYVWDDGGGR
jgi:osmotically-inducible protein OsmY